MSNLKLQASQVEKAAARFKHLVVSLRADQEISGLLETPSAWSAVQASDTERRLNRGDRVTIISSDGLMIADQAVVTKALGGDVWISKPLRMIKLEPTPLYEHGAFRVIPNGVGFSIESVPDGRAEAKVFASVEAAKVEIARRQPVKAA